MPWIQESGLVGKQSDFPCRGPEVSQVRPLVPTYHSNKLSLSPYEPSVAWYGTSRSAQTLVTLPCWWGNSPRIKAENALSRFAKFLAVRVWAARPVYCQEVQKGKSLGCSASPNKKGPVKNKHPFLFTGSIAEKCWVILCSATRWEQKSWMGRLGSQTCLQCLGHRFWASTHWTSGFCLFHFWVYSVTGTWKNSKWYNSVRIGLAAHLQNF